MHRLFLCDDAPAYRHLLREVFRDEDDLEVVGEACDGRECLTAVPQANPDLILLDINMPRMDGLRALTHLRTVAPASEVVVLSSEHPENAEREVLALGAVAFTQKPLDPFRLAGLMREKVRTLDRRRAPRAAA